MKVEMRRNRLAEYLSSLVSALTRQEVFAVMLAEGWYGERGFGTFSNDFRGSRVRARAHVKGDVDGH